MRRSGRSFLHHARARDGRGGTNRSWAGATIVCDAYKIDRAYEASIYNMGSSVIRAGNLGGHSGESMQGTWFSGFGAASESGTMKHGDNGQAPATAVGRISLAGYRRDHDLQGPRLSHRGQRAGSQTSLGPHRRSLDPGLSDAKRKLYHRGTETQRLILEHQAADSLFQQGRAKVQDQSQAEAA